MPRNGQAQRQFFVQGFLDRGAERGEEPSAIRSLERRPIGQRPAYRIISLMTGGTPMMRIRSCASMPADGSKNPAWRRNSPAGWPAATLRSSTPAPSEPGSRLTGSRRSPASPCCITSRRPLSKTASSPNYQVTVKDDLARRRTGLAGRRDVRVRVYDADNHLFFPGANQSTPADYGPPQHVEQAVIDDIARWLVSRRARLGIQRRVPPWTLRRSANRT
jgi:hypothetical protein